MRAARLVTIATAIATSIALVAAAGACARDPAEAVCPEIAAGDLVVTELRGPQTPQDAAGTWLELYNASGAAVDLAGIKVRFRRRDGSGENAFLVRRSLPAAAGAYTVLGLFPDDDPPAHVDYGFRGDHAGSLLPAAAVDVEACGALIDRAIYDALPRMGTYALGGEPDAERNDLPASWCTDATQIGAAFPGTPKLRNVACP